MQHGNANRGTYTANATLASPPETATAGPVPDLTHQSATDQAKATPVPRGIKSPETEYLLRILYFPLLLYLAYHRGKVPTQFAEGC